jgi:diguanylate cyclase (GGDEF)-like protein
MMPAVPPGAPLDPVALAAARAELEARLFAELPSATTAVAAATLGLLALIFFATERSRREMLLFALLACGVSLHVAGGIRSFEALPLSPALRGPLLLSIAFLLPALCLLFVLLFLDLAVSPLQRILLAIPGAGILLSLAPGLLPRLPRAPLAALSLVALAASLLATLAGPRARRRNDTALLFVGATTLLLAALADAARVSGVLLAGTRRPMLLGPAFLVFTALLLVAVADEGRRLLARATTDPLTNLANRGEFLARATRELVRAGRTERSFAIAMLDLDHFKSINDRYGHPAGDRVLAAAARTIAETLRGVDLCGRYGGEEFVLLLVEVDEPAAFAAVERVRDAIAVLGPPRVPRAITVSAGIAVHHPLFERATIADLIKRADAVLYESKRNGRDRSTLDGVRSTPPSNAAEVRYR